MTPDLQAAIERAQAAIPAGEYDHEAWCDWAEGDDHAPSDLRLILDATKLSISPEMMAIREAITRLGKNRHGPYQGAAEADVLNTAYASTLLESPEQ